MIAYMKGEVTMLEETSILLENNNMGFRIFMPSSDMERLRTGSEVKIHTYLSVREDAMQLYGFLTMDALQLFRQLLGVSGIGPKAALAVLSFLSVDDLRMAVLSEDTAAIAKTPGIGKKTAQKLILELKDKIDFEEAIESRLSSAEEPDFAEIALDARKEAAEALAALGYSSSEALRAVRRVEGWESMDVETLLKAALRQML